ncbi:MAG: hypothetical protein OQJ93_04125 [Ignavibacteriaceae bacterium]|nr:hypothetical protein [Ignavibacteriaceae bacterium]
MINIYFNQKILSDILSIFVFSLYIFINNYIFLVNESMDLVKVYLIQSITSAANNLRLNAQQIEVVGLLRETITNCEDVGAEFLRMKKSTELSKLAIRLSEIHSFLTLGKVDFVKISEQFREHSRYLIRDLNQFLENVSPQVYKDAFIKINNGNQRIIDVELVDRSNYAGQIMVNEDKDQNKTGFTNDIEKQMTSSIDFEKKILGPIKSFDELLKDLASSKMNQKELYDYIEIIQDNAALSNQRGFKVLAKMHMILESGFRDIVTSNLVVDKTVIDALRACLIVIVAVVKKKEVDISGYLNRAEEFARNYLKKSIQV